MFLELRKQFFLEEAKDIGPIRPLILRLGVCTNSEVRSAVQGSGSSRQSLRITNTKRNFKKSKVKQQFDLFPKKKLRRAAFLINVQSKSERKFTTNYPAK